MADVITRLKLESNDYDSKIQRAKAGLLQLENECRNAGKSLNDISKENLEFVRSLGQMETVSRSARGKVSELTSAFTDLSVQYKHLTDEEKKGDYGKALSASLVQLSARIKETKKDLADVEKELVEVGDAAGGLFGGKSLSGMLQVFGGNLMTKGFDLATSAVTTFVGEIGDAVKQGIELAKQGEGVRMAFERLGRGDILDGLREATHGTVTDIELMKAAVKFNDFKLPVEELGTMLAFAQQKAKDTGQSVDYMVDSIVTGLGRKSLMILDNLGLSASEIKERMKETGDMTKAVGAIIREQMQKAGDYVETAADRAQQANVSLQNKMEELGRKFAPLQEASSQLWTSMKIGILDVIGGPLTRLLNMLTEAGRFQNKLDDINSYGSNDGTSLASRHVKRLSDYAKSHNSDEVKQIYNQQISNYDKAEEQAWRRANAQKKNLNDAKSSIAQTTYSGTLVDASESQRVFLKELEKKWQDSVNEAKAWQQVKSEYKAGAKNVMSPPTNYVDGFTDPEKPITLKGTNPQERAQDMVEQALLDYSHAIDKARLEMESGLKGEADVKKANLSAQERLYDAYGRAYATYADPKYKAAQDAAAAEIVKLAGEVKTATEQQKKTEQSARELEQAQKKQAEAYFAAINAWNANDLKSFYKASNANVAAGGQPFDVSMDFTLTDNNLSAFISNLKEQLSQAELGSDLYNNLTAQLADANMLGSFISLAVQNGIDVAEIDPQTLWSKIFGDGKTAGDFIPSEFWEGLKEEFEKATGQSFNLDLNSGNIKEGDKKKGPDLSKSMETLSTALSGLSNIASGLQGLGIKLDDDVTKALTTVQSFMQVVQGVSTVVGVIASLTQPSNTAALTANSGGLSFNTAAIWAMVFALKMNTATNLIPGIATGGMAWGGRILRAAGGAVVPGNFGYDAVPALLQSGEVVLNKAQQGNLASQLSDSNPESSATPFVTGETIWLGLNNYLRGMGYGEIVTSQNG